MPSHPLQIDSDQLEGQLEDRSGDALETARTNPAFPVAGAFGFVLLLVAWLKRRRVR